MVIKNSKKGVLLRELDTQRARRYFMGPFHKSLFICSAGLPIKDEGDADADTGQGHLLV